RTKVPVAEYIRQGIDLVLDRYKDQMPGQVGLFDGSSPPSGASPKQ
ncbi:MAG: ribbon-helix-helix domain-containing protein, partial [Sulfurifustaceae bacterium]